MLLNAERTMLLYISRAPYAVSAVGAYFRQDAVLTFWHLHRQQLLAPAPDNLSYHLSERGRAALMGMEPCYDVGEPAYRALFDYTRDAGEEW